MSTVLTAAEVAAGGVALEPEHEALRETVRRFTAERFPESEASRLAAAPEAFDRARWQMMANELGLQGLAIPEVYGGAGYGWVEQRLVFHEFGRALVGGPYLATVGFAVPALLACGDEAAMQEYLPRIAAGKLIATVAGPESDRPDVSDVRTSARRSGDGYLLDGVKPTVLDGAEADLFLVVARAEDGVRLFAVESAAPGLTIDRLESLDLGRAFARLTLKAVPARPIGTVDSVAQGFSEAMDRFSIAIAAEQTGIIDRVLQMSVEHAKMRVQFNRPIGSFQAIKHACADMSLALESCRVLVEQAAWLADQGSPLAPASVAATRARCADETRKATYDCIHLHGGLGFTWEHPAHLYFRRAHSTAVLLGGPEVYREELARRIRL
ncbi:acyl-CoA dehydrogenase family protein [Blastococcus sp. URHD0036]|uniref:acyl-CoA dehydrogenase family protein n=1 Tax=Blastococcus sp. URHD0036 TaxID=1380356 RepID=UPI00068C75D9|nr:acyl-CoA dehydrogenase family protein [Blastococcus sp. URHD0036]